MHAAINRLKKLTLREIPKIDIMSIKAFADLGIFTLLRTTDEHVNDHSRAYDYLMDSDDRKRKIAAFIRGIVWRCNNHSEDLDWDFETDLLIEPHDFPINNEDVYNAIVVAQFGPRMFPHVGPAETSTAEKRYEYACKHFVSTLQDALSETGTGKTADFASISQPIADRLRFMFIELRRAAKGFAGSMAPYRYELLTTRCTELYGHLEDDDQTPESEARIRAKIDHIRQHMLTPEENTRFSREFEDYAKTQREAELARRERRSTLLVRVRNKALAARLWNQA